MNKTALVSAFFIAFLLFIASQLLSILWPFFGPIFWAILIAYMVYPAYEGLRRRTGLSPRISALAVTAGVVAVVVPVCVFGMARLAAELSGFVRDAAVFVRGDGLRDLIEHARDSEWVRKLQIEGTRFAAVEKALTDWALAMVRSTGGFTVEKIGALTRNALVFAAGGLLTLGLVFVFLKDGQKVYGFVRAIAPLHEEDKEAVFGKITETFSAVIRGQILSALAQGAVAGVVYGVLGLPLPVLGAMLTTGAALMPIGGASMIWLPYTAYLVMGHAYTKAGVLFVLGVFVISLIDNFLKPAIIGEKTRLPYFLLFLVILGGLKVYGLSGIFIGPVMAALFFALIDIYREKYLGSKAQ